MSVIFVTVAILVSVGDATTHVRHGDIVFPDSVFSRPDRPKEIPLNLIRELNDVSENDVFKLFETFDLNAREFGLSERMESSDKEKFFPRTAKLAKCMPEMQTVCLNPNPNSATFFYPSCTRVARCGGCCSHHLLACQPVEKEMIEMSVVVGEYVGGSKLQFRGEKVVEVEQHTKCKCECKIRGDSCTKYQVYNPHKCQCECPNAKEEKSCGGRRWKKLWNSTTCSCMCREELECSSGYYFDPFSCTCTLYRSSEITYRRFIRQ